MLDVEVRLGTTINGAVTELDTAFPAVLSRDMRVLFRDALHTDVIIRPTPNAALPTASTLPSRASAAASASAVTGSLSASSSTSSLGATASPLAVAASGGSSSSASGASGAGGVGGASAAAGAASASSASDLGSLDNSLDRRAHKGVLAARSPVFRAMFSATFKESKENIVEMRYPPAVCDALLEYMYTGGAFVLLFPAPISPFPLQPLRF